MLRSRFARTALLTPRPTDVEPAPGWLCALNNAHWFNRWPIPRNTWSSCNRTTWPLCVLVPAGPVPPVTFGIFGIRGWIDLLERPGNPTCGIWTCPAVNAAVRATPDSDVGDVRNTFGTFCCGNRTCGARTGAGRT